MLAESGRSAALLGLWFSFFLAVPTYAGVPKTPSFAEPIANVTAAVGGEAVLQCTIDNLGSFMIAWIKVDTGALLSYHTYIISRDNKLNVTYSNSRRHWFLHIKNLNVSHKGSYMCRINTEPMISEIGYLDVTEEKHLGSSTEKAAVDSIKPHSKHAQHPTQGSQTEYSGSCQMYSISLIPLFFHLAISLIYQFSYYDSV